MGVSSLENSHPQVVSNSLTRGKSARSSRRYKFEAALSFAGEDRTHAESLFRELRKRGLRVFYDTDRQASLWGKDSREFEQIYSSQTRYVIPFISKSYVQKDWTQFEFDTAKREQKKRGSEFILPVRLDDSRLLGLPDQVVIIDARERSIAQIARLVIEKCHAIRSRNPDNRQRTIRNISVNLLAPEARRALGLIAAAAVPLPVKYFEKLLPKYNWRRLIRTLRRAGLVHHNENFLRLSKPASQAMRADPEERKRSTEAWIDRLRPLGSHIDMAVFLSLHLLTALRFEEAGRAAVDVAQYTSLGFWNQVYLALLSRLARRRAFSKMTRGTQVQLLNSLGIRLCEAGRHREALRRFAQLNQLSRKYRNSWGVGQSLINAGVAAVGLGDQGKAEKFYASATAHAKRSRDQMLLGRALSNLAQLCENRDLGRAESLLEESLKAKAAARDLQGLAVGSAVRGAFAVTRGDFALAAHWYGEASRAAARLGLRYEHALCTYNHGRALQDGGRMAAALRLYEKARRLAADDDYGDILVLSLNALGAGAFETRQYRKVESVARELLAVAARTKNREYELSAFHMLAVSSLTRRGKLQSAAKFRATINRARAYDAPEWVIRCIIDSTRERTRRGIGSPDLARLRRTANAEAAAGHQRIAAGLWKMVGRNSAFTDNERDASSAYAAAEKCLSLSPDSAAAKLELYREWYGRSWQARRYGEAIKLLGILEDAAKQSGFKAEVVAAMDQRGVCLQELGKHADAEALHRASATAAERLGNDHQQERSLNNLGETLRFLGRDEEAVRVLGDSEKISRRARRLESAISTAHNRALALESLGKFEEAGRTLRHCRDEAANHLFWYEHVRAREGLANLAWTKGKVLTALHLYQQVMSEARKRGIRALEPRIALNLSRLLSARKEWRAGLRLLEKFRPQFDQFVNAHLYFQTLANLYDKCGHPRDAAVAWSAAKSRAKAIGDAEAESYCASQETRALEQNRNSKSSDIALRSALKTERDPRRRTILLIQRLLTTKSKSVAQRSCDEALRLCTEHSLHDQKKHLYLLVGDKDLNGNYRSKLNAFKAYAMGMISTAEADFAGLEEVVSHIVLRIAIDSPVKEEELERLINDLTSHLPAELTNATEASRLLLWPFHLAKQIAPFREQPQRLLTVLQSLTRPKSIDRYLAEFQMVIGREKHQQRDFSHHSSKAKRSWD